MYFAGIVIILVGALLIKAITGSKKRSYFIIELPEYKLPSLKTALKSMLNRGWSYIVKAGTVIMLCNAVVFVAQSFDWRLNLVEEGAAHTSILASISAPIAVLLVPIGVSAWQMAAATITGFIAKENVVGTLAVCYGISNLINVDELAMEVGAASSVAEVFGLTPAAALASLVFNLFSPPCFAAIGAMNSELKSAKWLFGGIGLQIGVGYTAAFLVNQIGSVIIEGRLADGFVGGLVAVVAFVAILAVLCVRNGRKSRA